MTIRTLNWNEKKIGFFKVNGYLKNNSFDYFYELERNNTLKISAIQQQKMIKKIVSRNQDIKIISMIVQIRHIYKNASIDDIYRVEILDDDGNIIDAINIHKEGVPKEIREEFDKQFRNEDGTDRIIPLKS